MIAAGPGHTARRALFIGLIALAVRLLFIAAGGRDVAILPGHDAVSYDAFAHLVLSGVWAPADFAFREPLYPYFMAFAYVLPGGELGALQILQGLAGAASTAVLYLALRRAAGETVALISAALIAFNPHFVTYTIEPLRENLVIPLFAGFISSFIFAASGRRDWQFLVCALFYALLVHTDVRFLPLVAVIPLMFYARTPQLRAAIRDGSWVLLFFVLLMIPYQLRVSASVGEPVIVTTRFLGKWLARATAVASGPSEASAGLSRQDWLRAFEERKRENFESLSPEEQRQFQSGLRPATGRLAVHAFLAAEYWRFTRLGYDYRPYPDGRLAPPWSPLHSASSALVVVPFLILFPFVFVRPKPELRDVAWPLIVYLSAHFLMHVFVHARERYRVPMELITSILIAIALVNIWSLWKRRRA